jgi:hypothetical protein
MVYKSNMYRHYQVAGAWAIGHGRVDGLPVERYGAAAHGMADYQERSVAGHGSTSAAQAAGSALVCQGGRSELTGDEQYAPSTLQAQNGRLVEETRRTSFKLPHLASTAWQHAIGLPQHCLHGDEMSVGVGVGVGVGVRVS